MRHIQPNSKVEHEWPRQAVAQIETRKRDLVVRIADWTRYREEPAYDVEVYIGGVYDWNESKVFSIGTYAHQYPTKQAAKQAAAAYASKQIARLL